LIETNIHCTWGQHINHCTIEVVWSN